MDRIRIDDLRLMAVIGALPHEREAAQPLRVDLAIGLDLSDAGRTDEQGLAAAVNKRFGPEQDAKPGFRPGQVVAGPLMKLADSDGDKKLSSDELLTAVDKLFDQFDREKTGYLDEQTFGELLNSLFPNLGGPPAPPKKEEKKP